MAHIRSRKVLIASLICFLSCVVACHDVALDSPGGEPERLRANLVDSRYLLVGDHYYVHLLAVQGGWSGWKERRFSKDGLRGIQIVLRLPANPIRQVYLLPGPVDGYVFEGTAMGAIAAWQIAGGTLTAELPEGGLILSGEVQIDPTYPQALASSRPAGRATLCIKKTRLRPDLGVPANILAAANLEIEPRLRAWQTPLSDPR